MSVHRPLRKFSRKPYRRLLVNRLDDKLLVVEGDVSDFTPRESNLRRKPVNTQQNEEFGTRTTGQVRKDL